MSGASEATLQELLATNQQMAAALTKMAGTAGGAGAGAGPQKQATALGKAMEGAGTAIGVATGIVGKALSPALAAAASGLQAVVQSGRALYQNQLQLAEGAIQGTNSLASLTAGLEQMPGILGLAMKAYNYQIKKMEANVKTYQDISTVGARFGGSLDEVRRSAASSYLSMDEFASVMKAAGPQLRFMGTSADDGAKNLVKFNSTMIKGEVGKGLLGMGYSLTEANNMLASYSEAVGGLKADQLKDQREMEKSVKFFAEELDAAAQLEGKTRQQKEQEMKEASQQAAIKAKLAEMGPEEQKKYLQAYNAALRIGGKGAAEALQSQLLGLPPMTKAAQQFTAVNGAAAQTVAELGKTVEDGTSATESRNKMDRLAAKGQKESADMYKSLGTTGKALSFANGNMAETVNAGAKNYADGLNQNLQTEEDWAKRTENVRNDQEKASKSQVGAIVQAQGAAKHAGGIMDMLYEALKPLVPYILALNDAFMKFLPVMAQFAADVIEKGIGIIKDIFSKVDWGKVQESFMGAWNILTKTFGGIWDALKNSFGGQGSDIGVKLQEIFTKLMSMFGSIIDTVGYVVKLFIESPLFETLKKMFEKMWGLVQSLVDAVVTIVKSPIGTFIIKTLMEVFDLFGMIINAVIDAVVGIVDVVTGIVKFISGDFKGGWEAIKKGLGNILGGILDFFLAVPKYVGEQIKNIWNLLKDAVIGLLGSIVDGIKSLGTGIVNFFTGGGKKDEAPAAPKSSATTPAPTAPNTPQTAEAQKRAEETAKTTTVAASSSNANTPAAVAPKSSNPQDMLIAELQTLNKMTTEMLRAIRDTSDYTKSTANILASNGNLFKRA